MVKATLVDRDFELGTRVLHLLDEAKFSTPVALWLLQKDRGDWKFVVATPLYERLGPQRAYLRFFEIVGKDPLLSQIPIRLESTRDPLVKALRTLFGKTASCEGMHLGLQSIGGVWVDEAYVYRIG